MSDCNDFSILKIQELKNLNYLIIDCLKFTQHPSHFNLEESLYVHQYLKPKKITLTYLIIGLILFGLGETILITSNAV